MLVFKGRRLRYAAISLVWQSVIPVEDEWLSVTSIRCQTSGKFTVIVDVYICRSSASKMAFPLRLTITLLSITRYQLETHNSKSVLSIASSVHWKPTTLSQHNPITRHHKHQDVYLVALAIHDLRMREARHGRNCSKRCSMHAAQNSRQFLQHHSTGISS
jgi:hypothetical protein